VAEVREETSPVHELENRPMRRMGPRRSYLPWIAIPVAVAMLMAGCASSSEAGPTEPASKVGAGTTAPSEPAVGETVLHLRGSTVTHSFEVAIYADGRVIWAIGDGDPGYLQRRLTPEGVERLRSRAVSSGLFEQDQGLTLDDRPGGMEIRPSCCPASPSWPRGSMELRRGDRSVVVVWTRRRNDRLPGPPRQLERISAATAEQEAEVSELVAFFGDPTAWTLPRRMYVQPETSPFVASRIRVVYDGGEPDWSTLPSPAREIIGSSRLEGLSRRDPCRVMSTDQARELARALTQAGIGTDYDRQRGLPGFRAGGSFVHSFPALPHEVAC
jgi:hypothetical protein